MSEDEILGGRVRLLQPSQGYRTAIDPVLLAAAARVEGPARVLDVGTGTGAALLCLLARCPQAEGLGLELLPDHAALARRALMRNKCHGRAAIVEGDLTARPERIPGNAFDVVISNPPYAGPGTPPMDPSRATAHMEAVPLADWVAYCLRCLRQGGQLVIIHRADRLPGLLAALDGKAGGVEIIPLWPKAGQPAKRVIVRAVKGSGAPAVLHPGLVLHADDGAYTQAAEAVLRDAAAL